MTEEKGIFEVPLKSGTLKLQFNTYTLRLLSKYFTKDLGETFAEIGNIQKVMDMVIAFVICGAESFNGEKLEDKKACSIVDELGGVNGKGTMELLNFAISCYMPKVADDEKKKE